MEDTMYLIVIAWGYVVAMMAVAEASSPQGSWLGALITLLMYGVLPLGLVMFIGGTPARKRRLQAQRDLAQAAWNAAPATPTDAGAPAGSHFPDAGSHAPGAAEHRSIATVREKD